MQDTSATPAASTGSRLVPASSMNNRLHTGLLLLALTCAAGPAVSAVDLPSTPNDAWVVDGQLNVIVRTADTT